MGFSWKLPLLTMKDSYFPPAGILLRNFHDRILLGVTLLRPPDFTRNIRGRERGGTDEITLFPILIVTKKTAPSASEFVSPKQSRIVFILSSFGNL